MDQLAIGFAAEGTASGRHHNVIELGTSRQLFAFGRPEDRLAAPLEHLWYRSAESSADLLIEIDESATQSRRQRHAYRALSRTHEANKENARHTHLCYHSGP
jgi:hypothetical protein